MKIKIYETITGINEKEWDAIVGRNRLICRHKYLEAIEKSQINDTRYYYPVVYENGEIIAHACVYYISTELDTFAKGFLKKIISMIRKVWKGFLVLRSLECGTPVAIGNTISFKPGVDKKEILKLLAREIESLAKRIKVKVILFRDFYDDELCLFDDLRKLGYTKVYNLPNTKMEIRWRSFEEYLDEMRSHYKGKAKRNISRFQQEGVAAELLKDFSNYADELQRLWTYSYNHATEYKREILNVDFFKNINRYLMNCSAVVLVKKDNIPIGFSLLLFEGEILIPLFCGVDYKYNEKYAVYFNLFYQVIAFGIKEEMKDIDMGITTLSVKKDLGADVFALNMYMKHLNPYLNKIVPKIFSMMTPCKDIKSRPVFKADREKDDLEIGQALKTGTYRQPVYQ